MTEGDAQRLLTMLATAFPDEWRFLAPDQQRDTRALYRRMLADLDPAIAGLAVQRLIATSRKMPKIAEIRSACAAMGNGREHKGAEAWGHTLKLIGRYGYTRRPLVDFPIADMIEVRCIEALGWRELCLSECQAADRARFIQLYEQLAIQAAEDLAVGKIAAPIPRREIGAGPRALGDIVGGLLPKES